SVRDLRGLGITPTVIVARSETAAPASARAKLSLFSGLPETAIALLPNAPSIYQVPLTLEETGIAGVLCKQLGLKTAKPELGEWRRLVDHVLSDHRHHLAIGIVAKYMDNQDTYMCVFEALRAAGWTHDASLTIKWVDAEAIEKGQRVAEALEGVDGIVVPGGFGTRGLEGKIKAAQYALTTDLPYLGLCLGLQMGVIAAARNAGLKDATTEELNPRARHQVISTMASQRGKENTGGTMRLGDYPCVITKGSKAAKAYNATKITERHRHRYECNNDYRPQYEAWGIKAVGASPDGRLVEMIEAINHPFFMASQFHPEFKSRPNRPHPMFDAFVQASLAHQARTATRQPARARR
ncbi:MAG TPA: CTP synthase, partial [Candidatus Saccharimonas sp.]|nr:CTP synthase [Candidatus Saccharimonas sp.]